MRVLGVAAEEIRRRRGNGGFRAIENPGVALMIIRVASGKQRIARSCSLARQVI